MHSILCMAARGSSPDDVFGAEGIELRFWRVSLMLCVANHFNSGPSSCWSLCVSYWGTRLMRCRTYHTRSTHLHRLYLRRAVAITWQVTPNPARRLPRRVRLLTVLLKAYTMRHPRNSCLSLQAKLRRLTLQRTVAKSAAYARACTYPGSPTCLPPLAHISSLRSR